MAHSIGPRGKIEIISPAAGPERSMRIVSFPGRGDSGFIPAFFNAGEPPVTVVNMSNGKLETFVGTVTGGISQDTGVGNATGVTFFAIVADTGTAGI